MLKRSSGFLKSFSAFLLSGALLTGAGAVAYAQAATFNITEMNFAIQGAPATVRAGQALTFNVTNPGPAGSHNLAIDGNGANITSPDPNVAPATNGTLHITAPTAPGTYNLFCPVGQHRANGMEVKITVAGAATAGVGLPATGGAALPIGLVVAGLLSGAAGIILRRRSG